MKRIIFIFSIFILHQFSFSQDELRIDPQLIPLLNPKNAPFYHGVASGDPSANSIVIWTKVVLPNKINEATIEWEIAKDSLFTKKIASGKKLTDETLDFTLKVLVENLKPNSSYYYRFKYSNTYSQTGQTKTLSEGKKSIQLAFVSCSNYEYGYFTNYKSIAENKSIDLVIHLGDYIYEYGVGVYGDTTIGRKNIPSHEIISLNDYRTRYSLYRLDPDLQKMHQLKPIITTWDDHEIADNTYIHGAENHQSNEGEWKNRKNDAIKAYYEWLPLQKDEKHPLYRSFSFGKLLNLSILDTRVVERSLQVDSIDAPNINDSSRTILGKNQFTWLTQNLSKNYTWNIIGNQVPFGPMYSPSIVKKETYMDGWDGYPWERKKLVNYMQKLPQKNIVIVTGDYHRAYAIESDEYGTKDTNDNIAIEFITPSITSANDDEYYGIEKVPIRKERYLLNNPQIKYLNNKDHGYLLLTIDKNKIETSFVYCTTIRKPGGMMYTEKTFIVRPGHPVLNEK